MSRTRGWSLVVVLASMAGCANILGGCDPTHSIEWRQPGLYGALAASGEESTLRDPAFGFPLSGLELPPALAQAQVRDVAWRPGGSERAFREVVLTDVPSPEIRVVVPVEEGDAGARERFRAFVMNVSEAPERWDEWETALLASRDDAGYMSGPDGEPIVIAYGYRVRVEGPWRFGELVEELGGLPDVNATRFPSPGEFHLKVDDWSLGMQVPLREWETRDGGLLRIWVDVLDQARAHYDPDGPEVGSGHETVRVIQAATTRVGAGPAPVDASQLRTVVC